MAKIKLYILFAVGVLAVAGLFGAYLFFQPPKPVVKIAVKAKKPAAIYQTMKSTNLLHLRLTHIPFPKKKYHKGTWWKNHGTIIKVGKKLLVFFSGEFYHFNIKTKKLTQIDIALPKNGHSSTEEIFKISLKNNSELRFLGGSNMLVIKNKNKNILLLSSLYLDVKNLCKGLMVARLDFPLSLPPIKWRAKESDWKIIFKTKPCVKVKKDKNNIIILSHYSHIGAAMLTSKKPNTILLTLGDLGDLIEKPKLLGKDYGTLVELNINTGQTRIIARGLRNPQGMAYDDKGQIWVTDHGPIGGDEVNLIKPGKHYGWPFVSYGTDNTRRKLLNNNVKKLGKHDGYEKPRYAFVPSIGIFSIDLIKDFSYLWDGDLIVSSGAARSLYRLRVKNNQIIFAEPIKMGHGIRKVFNYGDGKIILIALNKSIIIMEKQTEKEQKTEMARLWGKCASCHGISGKGTGRGPAINNIFKGKIKGLIGGDDKWIGKYSPAFQVARQNGLRWRGGKFKNFIQNPNAMFNKTEMPNLGITKRQAKLIRIYLRDLKDE